MKAYSKNSRSFHSVMLRAINRCPRSNSHTSISNEYLTEPGSSGSEVRPRFTLSMIALGPSSVRRIIRPVRPVDPGMRARSAGGITGDTISVMAMTLRLDEAEAEALRRRAEREQRSMQDVARQAIREYIEEHSRAELLDRVLDEELPRYAEALERLGQ
jgi:predicted transcriptional regulator